MQIRIFVLARFAYRNTKVPIHHFSKKTGRWKKNQPSSAFSASPEGERKARKCNPRPWKNENQLPLLKIKSCKFRLVHYQHYFSGTSNCWANANKVGHLAIKTRFLLLTLFILQIWRDPPFPQFSPTSILATCLQLGPVWGEQSNNLNIWLNFFPMPN